MTNTAHIEALIIRIEDIREGAKTSEHGVIDTILSEIRETHDIIQRNDMKVLNAVNHLSQTYLKIQAL